MFRHQQILQRIYKYVLLEYIVPIFKKGDPKQPANYKGIALTSTIYISLFAYTPYKVVHRKCKCIQTKYLQI